MTIRWGFIGISGFARLKPLTGIIQSSGSLLTSVVTRSGSVEFTRDHPEVEVWSDVDDFLRRAKVDAVYIATPVDTHFDLGQRAMEAGKHVLLEKPMTLNIKEAELLRDFAEKSNLRLGVGFMRRHHPAHIWMKKKVDEGTLGKIVLAKVQTLLESPPQEDAWRWDPGKGIGGAFADVGSHNIEQLEHVLGRITKVNGVASGAVYNSTAEDTAVAVTTHANGAIGIVEGSFAVPHRHNVFELYGTKGTLMASDSIGPFSEAEVELLGPSGSESAHFTGGDITQFAAQFDDFSQAIKEGCNPAVDAETGVRNLKQIFAVYESAKNNGKAIELD